MQQQQGAMYARFFLDGFLRTRGSKDITTSVFLSIRNLKTGKAYVVTQSAVQSVADSLLIWKIPAGDYLCEKVTVNENTGITREWAGKTQPTFSIRSYYLSNLGEIHLSPLRNTELTVNFLPKPNTFTSPGGEQTFVGVINGYSARLQTKLGGEKLALAAKDNFGSSSEVRTAFSTTRQISMLYQLNSDGSQKSRTLMAATIGAQDSDLRRCYMDQIELAAGLRGTASFKFQIAANSGSFEALDYSGGTLKNEKVLQCLSLTLKKIQFPVVKTLTGRLVFKFNYDDNPGRPKFP